MQSIQAKIDDETARQLDAVIKHTGFRTRYELLRCLVTAFLHYADREGKEGHRQQGRRTAEPHSRPEGADEAV